MSDNAAIRSCADVAGPGRSPPAETAATFHATRADFQAGRIRIQDGWVIAETQAARPADHTATDR